MPSRNVIKVNVPESYYHVYARGSNKHRIFQDDSDYLFFLSLFERYLSKEKPDKQSIDEYQKLFDSVGNSTLFENDNILFRSEFHNRKILHIQQCDVFGFTQHQVNKINSAGVKIGEFSYLKSHPKKFNNFDEFFYNRNLNIDIKQVINEVILFKSSRMGELFENNISFPYMSTELYDFLNTLPVDYKFHGTLDELGKGKGVSKYLHKKYLKSKLPKEITERKKQGGFAPLPIFLKDEKQRKQIFTFLINSDLVKQLFKYKAIDNLLKQYDEAASSKSYWFWYQQVKANQVINLLTLAVWWEMLINKKTKIELRFYFY